MYGNVLVATDGSDCADAAASHAVELADVHGAELHALYVVDQSYPAMSGFDTVVERMEAEGEAALDTVGASAAERDVSVSKTLRRGRPYEEILGYAAHNDVDVVVLGATGRTGMDRLIHAGSTTTRVVRRSHVPVIAVPPPGREPIA